MSKYIGPILVAAFVAISASTQAQPSKSVMWRDTVRVCELAGQGVTDDSTPAEVLDALKAQFSPDVLTFPRNPGKTILKRIEVQRPEGCKLVEWEFYFLANEDLDNTPFEVVPEGLGKALFDKMLYNPGCGCKR